MRVFENILVAYYFIHVKMFFFSKNSMLLGIHIQSVNNILLLKQSVSIQFLILH